MELIELVQALMEHETLHARQWVSDAMRAQIRWTEVVRPSGLNPEQLAVAAGVAELLAQRMGQAPPDWTSQVAQSPVRLYLVQSAKSMPRLRILCETEGPEPLRKRNVMAPPEFLTVA